MTTVMYARLEDLQKIITQAESEHHEGSLGLVRIALKPSDMAPCVEIDSESPLMSRVLIG